MLTVVFPVWAHEGHDGAVHRDVSYVPVKLDQSVDPMQTLDIYADHGAVEDMPLKPVILFIHGGGWAFGDKNEVDKKPAFFTERGFAFVSMNYRLRWDYKVYDQLIDIVSAVKWIRENGAEYGLDGDKIVLMGHASGAHLASLVVADDSYFKIEGLTNDVIKAVVAIDSTSYDIVRLMNELGSFVERRHHQLVFTADEKVWEAASPVTHIDSKSSLPPFALLYNPENEASTLQAKGFAKVLATADTPVILVAGSAEVNQRIGAEGDVTTGAMMAFLRTQI